MVYEEDTRLVMAIGALESRFVQPEAKLVCHGCGNFWALQKCNGRVG